jgi:hypothetical protein
MKLWNVSVKMNVYGLFSFNINTKHSQWVLHFFLKKNVYKFGKSESFPDAPITIWNFFPLFLLLIRKI